MRMLFKCALLSKLFRWLLEGRPIHALGVSVKILFIKQQLARPFAIVFAKQLRPSPTSFYVHLRPVLRIVFPRNHSNHGSLTPFALL